MRTLRARLRRMGCTRWLTVAVVGAVGAAKTADLDFTASGTVTDVYVAEGDRVHKGQRLARVDDDALVATR